MKKRTFIMGLAALALAFGSAGVIGGVSLSANDSAIMTRAAVGDDIEIGEGTYKEIYRTGFENSAAGTDYKGTQTYDASATDGLGWTIYYGTVSTNKKISGSKSAQMRLYSDKKCGYLMNTSVFAGCVDAIQFTYAVSNKSVTFNVDYSTDGTTWNTIESVSPSSTDNITYEHEFSESLSNFRVRIAVTGGFPSSGNNNLRVDDIVFAQKKTDPALSVDGDCDVALKKGDSKTLSLLVENMPEGGTVSAETGDSAVATVAVADNVLSINGVSVGETTYTVSLKNSGGTVVASCTGTIAVSVDPAGLTVISDDFSNGDTLSLGKAYQLRASVSPTEALQDVTWSSSDAAATIDDNGLVKIVSNTTETVVITAKSAADDTISGTISFKIDNNIAISDLVSSDGTNLGNSITSETEVVVKGTITTFEGTSAYIQSGDAGLMVYTNGTALSEFKIGDGVKVTGKAKIYNGLVEITSPSVVADESAKEEVSTIELAKADLISSNTGRLATSGKAVCLSNTKVASATANYISVGFKFAGSTSTSADFYVNVKKAYYAEVGGQFGDFEKDGVYNIKGIFLNWVTSSKTTPEIMIETTGCYYYNNDIQEFIEAYIDGATGTTCKSKYEEATEAMTTLLTTAQQNVFKTASAYAEAYEEYKYWGDHQNDSNGVKLVNNTDSTSWSNIAVIAGAFLLASAASVYFFLNKKKQDR